jgi:hypothetical protein
MRLKLSILNGKPFLTIKYEDEEWSKVKQLLERLGLKEYTTNYGFGIDGLKLKFYRETDTELLNYLKNTINIQALHDDINKPALVKDFSLNLAIFRVIPDENNEVKVPLDKYITIVEFKEIVNRIVSIYEKIFNILTDAEVEIKVKKGESNDNGQH